MNCTYKRIVYVSILTANFHRGGLSRSPDIYFSRFRVTVRYRFESFFAIVLHHFEIDRVHCYVFDYDRGFGRNRKINATRDLTPKDTSLYLNRLLSFKLRIEFHT